MKDVPGCNKRLLFSGQSGRPTIEIGHITRGLSFERASLYGMPHIHCTPKGITGCCAVCGREATEKHHIAPKGMGNRFMDFPTRMGVLRLESSLVALCHSCHDKFPPQGTECSLGWAWKDDRSADLFWSGALFEMGIYPHSPDLYEYGFYVLKRNGRIVEGYFG